jgi:hypothetical protein
MIRLHAGHTVTLSTGNVWTKLNDKQKSLRLRTPAGFYCYL